MSETTQRIFSVNEAARFLRIGRGTIYNLVAKGALKPFKIGKRTLFELGELEKLICAVQPA